MCSSRLCLCVCFSPFSLEHAVSMMFVLTLLRIWTCFCVFLTFNPNTRTTTGLFLIYKQHVFTVANCQCKRMLNEVRHRNDVFYSRIQCSHLFWVRVNFSYMKCSSSHSLITKYHLNVNEKEQIILKYFCAFCDSVVRC